MQTSEIILLPPFEIERTAFKNFRRVKEFIELKCKASN